MAINKTMQLVLKALSYPDIDVRKTYKLERAAQIASAKIRGGVYNTQDIPLLIDGREILTRIYTPEGVADRRLLLFFHGGGWVTENIDTYNQVCMNLADATGCHVASVEYSLAPEKPFPNAVNDCYAVAREIMLHPVLFNVLPEDVILIGDSAGGNLAAVVSQMARDRGEFRIHRQILIYPATYNDHTETSPFASVRTNGADYLLTSRRICEYMDLYCPDELSRQSAYFAPLLAKDFSNQPETLVITAEFDPLRDEGEAYAKALEEAGNRVRLYRMPDALHAFFQLDATYPHVQQAMAWINEFINGDDSNDE